MEILLVEDSLTAARLTIGALKNGGLEHRMTWLTDGLEASEFLHRIGKFARAPQPDLVLLDMMLPGKSGRELLEEMRSNDDLKGIPVVIMTGTVAADAAADLQQLHVQGFLTKPVDLEDFLKLVEELKGYWKADMIVPTQ